MISRASLAAFVFAFAMPARADLAVYDDALQNGFQDWSYGGGSDFANASPVHAGTRSIRLTGNNYNALSFQHAGAFTFAQYPGLHFWIHGGTAGNQQLTLFLENGSTASAGIALNAYIAGGAPAANAWREVTVPIATIPAFTALGQFDRIDIQSNSAGAQPAVYFDDVALTGTVVDPIFANGFDGGGAPAANGLVIDRDVPIDGLSGDRFTWRDSANLPRVAVLAHNDAGNSPSGSRGGELREFRYQVGAATRVVRPTDDGFGGFGYVVSHAADDASHCTGGGDSSSLGHFTPGQFQRVFEGRHHAIFRFTQNYPRYCTTAAPAAQYNLPVTIDWVFSTGRDHPLWSITYDLSAVPAGRLEDDSRAPYGQMRIDGAASDGARAQIAGVAWGDYYKFASSSNPVTFGSAWSWSQANTIPYVKLWTSTVDATMGIVQTRTIRQQDAGGYWGQDLWGKTSANGNGCNDPGSVYLMPCDYDWPFQSVNYELYGGPTQNARLAWGTNFGFLGQSQYRIRGNANYGGGALALPGDPMAPGWPRKSYATWIVLGTNSSDPVGKQVGEAETIQNLTLTATIGSVVTQGASGVADASPAPYQPAGYDGVYGALAFNAASNRLDANIAVGSGTLRHPLVIVRGYAGALPATVKLGGAALARDVDYFPSLRAGASELWITLNRDLSGAANRLEIGP